MSNIDTLRELVVDKITECPEWVKELMWVERRIKMPNCVACKHAVLLYTHNGYHKRTYAPQFEHSVWAYCEKTGEVGERRQPQCQEFENWQKGTADEKE